MHVHVIRAVIAITLVGLAGCSHAVDSTTVSVTVKTDGKSCVVGHRDLPCSSIASVLTQDLGISKSAELRVSPEGCGERAMARSQKIADELRRAGFKRIANVGFLTEPNSDCVP
jgi:biopolymer transport protein ExbD